MAVIRPTDLTRFKTSGWQNHALIFVYGADEGAVRELCAGFVKSALGTNFDEMNHIVLDGDQIAQDPARLADEAQTFGMFGGERVIHLRNGSKCPTSVLQSIVESNLEKVRIIIEAGDLKSGTGLRNLAEKHSRIATIACYSDNNRSLSNLITEVLSTNDMTINADARDYLISALGADRSMSRSELDKLMTYATGESKISLPMVQSIISDAGRLESSAVIDAAFTGEISFIETEANRLFSSGIAVAGIMTQALGHALFLRRAKRAADSGLGPEAIAKQHRLHFSRQPALERALRLWTDQRLNRSIVLLSDATLQTRKLPRIAEVIAVRALWATARFATRQTN